MPLSSVFMLGLLVVPFATALVIAGLGPARMVQIRWLALGATLVNLVLAILLTVNFLEIRDRQPLDPAKTKTFVPVMVPGATDAKPHQTTWNLMAFGMLGID